MRLSNHSEYQTVYLRNQAAFTRCQAAIAQWRLTDDPIAVEAYELIWTPTTARTFVQELAALFQHYNRVLWQHFSYCRQCGGQCCVVDASDVRPFDLLAIALLDEVAPTLPQQIATDAHACIYLNGRACSWPTGWRTIKCWSFYCLGSGPWDTSVSVGELYRAVTVELERVVATHLPAPLRCYEAVHGLALCELLDDPVVFANGLHQALDRLFVTPFHRRYPCLDSTADFLLHHPAADKADRPAPVFNLQFGDEIDEENGLALLAALSEAVLQAGAAAEEVLADLETLMWIVESRPAQGQALVQEMYQRYHQPSAPVDDELFGLWQQMRAYLQRFV